MTFALVDFGRSAIGAATAAAEDRFLVLLARSLGRSRRASSGRLDPFAAQFGYDCYLRIAVELERVLGERVAISRTGGSHFGFGLPSDYDG